MNSRKVLVCAPVMPEFDRESGSRRMFDLLMLLLEGGWAVSFVAQRAPDGERYARILQQKGIATYVGFDLLTDQIMTAGQFDLVIFIFWDVAEQHLPFIRRAAPSTRIIVDSVDIHFLRNARRIFAHREKGDAGGLLDTGYASEMVRELNIYAGADGVFAVSQKEAEIINDFLGDPTLAHWVPDCEDMPLSPIPFNERKGILFLGSFRHAPNVDAVKYLCEDVLPKVDPAILEEHPVYIVGTGLNDTIRNFGKGLPNVQMVGWVPLVTPYLEQARITVIPLLYGAGTKRKMVQALMVGTPTVSTSVGTEGLGLLGGENVLVADDAETFAGSITRLLKDQKLWQKLSQRGRAHILNHHGRQGTRQRMEAAIDTVLAKKPKPAKLLDPNKDQRYRLSLHYEQLCDRIRDMVQHVIPPDGKVICVSKGDEALLNLNGRQAWHFPQGEDGNYSGYYPATSADTIAHLETLRNTGASYLLFPSTAFWWLDHYKEFKDHLDHTYQRVLFQEDTCLIYALTPSK